MNIDHIHAVESLARGEYLVTLRDGTKLASGRNYRGNLHALMGKELSREVRTSPASFVREHL